MTLTVTQFKMERRHPWIFKKGTASTPPLPPLSLVETTPLVVAQVEDLI